MNDQPPAQSPIDIVVTQSLRAGDTPPTESDQRALRAAPAARIPGYEIVGVLGKGGMGIVYQARQTALKRMVALKMVLGDGLDDEIERARFRAEAEAAAALRHANLLQIYEVGQVDGRPFCSMEFAEGGSLAQQLRGEPRPARESAQLVATLACAIQAAHDAGIVHRDLKPANILLTAGGQPKIGDFGLAKRMGDPSGLTQSGTVLGTPSYMAPEQALGRTNDIGPAADVYSLGAILYELLTGRPPFRGASLLDTLQQVREQEPIPPSQLVPKVERDLETICLKCLEKSEHRRYASAADLADDLQRYLQGRPIVARRVGRLERVVKWAKREPVLATTSALLLLVIGMAFAVISWQLSITRQANRDLGTALGNETKAKNNEKKSREDAQKQTALKQAELERAEQALYVSRIAQARREWELRDLDRARRLLLAADPTRRGWEWHFLNRQTQRMQLEYQGHSEAHRVSFLAGGSLLLVQRDPVATLMQNVPPRVCVIDRTTGRETLSVQGDVAAASPDGKFVAVVLRTPAQARLYSAASGEPVRTLEGEVATGVGIHFGQRGETVIAVDQEGRVRCWNVADGKPKFEFQSQTKPLRRDVTTAAWAQRCVFSHDGSRLILNSGELLDCATGKPLAQIAPVRNACFSPDNDRLAVITTGWGLRLLESASGKVLQEFPSISPNREYLSKLTFSPDGKLLATCSGGPNVKVGSLGLVRLWNSHTGAEVESLTPGSNAVTAIAFSPNGGALALGGDGGIVQVRDAQSLEVRMVLMTGLRHAVTDFAFSPDGETLACADSRAMGVALANNATVRLWDLGSSQAIAAEFPAYQEHWKNRPMDVGRKELNRVSVLQFSTDAGQLTWYLNRSEGKRTQSRFQLAAGTSLAPGNVDIVPAPARRFLIVGRSIDTHSLTYPGKLVITDLSGTPDIVVLDEGTWNVWQTELSPDGQRLAATLGRALSWYSQPPPGYAVKVWDLSSGKEIFSTSGEATTAGSLAISPDGKQVAFHVQPDQLEVWDLDSRKLRRKQTTNDVPQKLVFSADGSRLAAGSYQGGIQLWNLEYDQSPLNLLGHQGSCQLLAFSTDRRRLFSGGEDLMVRIWDTASGQELLALSGPGEALLDLQVSPDDRWLAVADQAGRLQVWDGGLLPEPLFPTWPPTLPQLDGQIAAGLADAETFRLRAAGRVRAVNLSGAAEDYAAAAALDKSADNWRIAVEAAQKAYRYDLIASGCTELIKLNDRVADYWLWRGEARRSLGNGSFRKPRTTLPRESGSSATIWKSSAARPACTCWRETKVSTVAATSRPNSKPSTPAGSAPSTVMPHATPTYSLAWPVIPPSHQNRPSRFSHWPIKHAGRSQTRRGICTHWASPNCMPANPRRQSSRCAPARQPIQPGVPTLIS